jgi:hypothetical protein
MARQKGRKRGVEKLRRRKKSRYFNNLGRCLEGYLRVGSQREKSRRGG